MHDDNPLPQSELPLGLEAAPSVPAATEKRRSLLTFLASNRRQILVMGLTGACLLWGSWTTHKLLGLEQRVTTTRKVALADLVREYVQAEARSGAAPDQVTAETGAYLKALNLAVARHAAQGEVLLLSNAVVAGDVPDITATIRDETYASLAKPQGGAAVPSVASPATQMQQFFDAKGADHGSGK
ncbi:TrbI F-type domain-containing protein [Novosphingobium sp. Fuku2-ISO-50]|uniref:TrbI F-type domain-containing protein n=1 Tax=Novosphingobium sp. Fuku2-ISO-50 TaxID=1739114 RepID=UPI00076BF9D6|nr:TrbI F-type domain-containing protein [Novosphingobium sp. Fuku2-ISO-50]KUR74231.1 hypothetical protein AQZ50_18165 [Novosphingobium sp. Fuku2-ISO-50]